jgi:hypothetical protein
MRPEAMEEGKEDRYKRGKKDFFFVEFIPLCYVNNNIKLF